MYRMGGDSRANIARTDCIQYQLLKALDQNDLDQATAPGQHYLRDWNGQLVEDNSITEAVIQKQEEKFSCSE